MPNYGKGGKKRRKGKKKNTNNISKHVIIKEDEFQEYAIVIRMAGNCRIIARVYPSDERINCLIRGSMQKRVWIASNDLILISKMEFDKKKAIVIHKYPGEHISQLIKMKEITKKFTLEDSTLTKKPVSSFDFNDGDEDTSEDEIELDSEDIDEI